ncbi:DNA translocase SftA [Bacillus thuringiensis serovar morrisoni str. 4AA1]|uniref:DNA translocase FtsK n=1 Tax=Bacillus TaxID=1386 RepID=UPI0005AEDC8D|nr:DNA translocase FtsK [Bacillus thuringiensis]AMR87076.1 cell division protein FtsK [Bacillus thuringiensis]KIP23771.1 ftsK/SpoIIIE family protein [Bacillus thuringiensis serovar morrisoni]MBG9641119.1 cell division protein FtsK [Bacillus thuringiensis]MBG9676947.1 cell division protein FtsK [Bacillus thuringiensis]NUW47728.1 DNA translocase FtsK [Bacillus thuringiensis]
MLDWMKKLFNKEEEQTALNKEVQKQIESQPKIPRVNHYTEAREAQMASRNAGKCRFPLVPDNGFDEEDEREVDHFEEQPVQGVTYEEPTAQRGIQVERSRRPYVEKVVSTYEEPEVQYEPVREAVVKKASAPSQESNRRPFRPTEMISPIYGYNRPSVEKKVEKQEEVKEREDLEISVEGKAVVDAWLEKKGYTLSDFSEGQATSSSPSHESVGQQDKKQEKSVVDQWLEKNGYEIERQEPLVEEKEVIQGMSTPQEVSADELLHKTVAEQMESAKLEKDVVVLNENNLQEELVASKVEHEDTILSEEIKRNTEIKQPTIEVEKQAPEESVIVKAEEKLAETIIVEIPEEPEEVEVITETEEPEEVEVITETEEPEEVEVITETEEPEEVEVITETEEPEEVEVITETEEPEEVEVITETEEPEEVEVITETEELEEVEVITETEELEEVEVIAEAEESEEVEVIAEAEESEEVEVITETEEPEEVEVIAETEEPEEVEVIAEAEELEEVEVIAETEAQEEVEVIAETEEPEEVEVIAEAEELEEVEVIAETEAQEEVEVIAETEAQEEVEVIAEAEELEEVEVIAETEESEEVEVIAETEESEEVEVIAEIKAPVVETFVALEEIQQEDEAIEQKSEFIHVAEADEQTKNDVQSFANVLLAETEENKRVVEEAPVAEEQRVVEEAPVAEEQPVVKKEEPKREKKRHVPFNVVMLKQDRTRLMERHAARANAMQHSVNVRVENRPVQQVVAEPQVEEQPMQQVVAEPQVEEQLVQQVVAEPQVEEQPMQQVVAEPQVEEQPMQQVVAEPQVEEQPMQQVVVESQVEEQPMQQVVVESQVEEQPMQQVVVESQVEEQSVQQVVAEPQMEERPVQQVVEEQVQKPISSTEVQEKAYVVNQRENDMRNVLHTPPTYTVPPLALLSIPQQSALDNTEWLDEQKELLDTTFNNFHVGAHVINVSQGPAVTRFEVQPDPGVKVNKITNLSDDIKLSLAAKDIRIEAPIPGKSAIGIEVPNKESKPVFLREILRSPVFTKSESPLTVALGLDISGDPIVTDIRKMPHGLIAGATGSGKSVCINAILTSILYKAKPHEVKLMLIDPKMVELAPYNSVPHLVAPVITDVKAATAALKWAVEEMERRYELFAHAGARDLTRYNTIVSEREIPGETLPYIVIVIDELADLMMVAPGDVEEAICRIAQKARACGIHLLVATQRPSVDVITGLIKSNIPTRIAFTVSSQVDSRTIIDIGGAEKLLGRGDMLFLGNGTSKPVRVQGVYVSDDEIEKTVDHVRKQMKPNYLFKQEDLLAKTEQAESEDELFFEACQFVVEQGGASTSSVQRKFRIGYNRAARLIEEMQSQGIISEARGTKPRDVLISEDEFAAMQETNV